MITFFNDVDMATRGDWVPAVQFFGARGFFDSYDAAPHQPCDAAILARWAKDRTGPAAVPTRAELCRALFALK